MRVNIAINHLKINTCKVLMYKRIIDICDNLIVVMISQVYAYIQIQEIVCIKQELFHYISIILEGN